MAFDDSRIDFESADIAGQRKNDEGGEEEAGEDDDATEESSDMADAPAPEMAMSDSFSAGGGDAADGPTAAVPSADGLQAEVAPAPPSTQKSAAASPKKPSIPERGDDLEDIIEEMDEEDPPYRYRPNEPEKDTVARLYGFETQLQAKVAQGVDKLYAEYIKARPSYAKIPFYYIFVADLFTKMKRVDIADLILSNVVEVRPGDARWLRIYAYNLIAWGKAKEAVPIYRAITELREEDPQSFRDFGLAMEAIGQPVAALKLFEKVYSGNWDDRLEGMGRIIQRDLGRAANAALRTPGIAPDVRKMATKHAAVDASAKDKIVITASWDTDNTDIDLHVVQPDGTHVSFENMAPPGSAGTLSWDSTEGFGPEQYRNSKPMRGQYRVFLRYYSENFNAIQDGTFARVDFKVVERGIERKFTKTVFLKDQDEVRTLATLDYADPAAPTPPPNFKAGIAKAKEQLGKKQYSEAVKTLNGLGNRPIPQEEAQRHFHMARAQLGLKKFELAEQENQRALALDSSLVAAHFNNACARSLAHDQKRAIFHLNLLADALQSRPDQRTYFLRIMGNDADLANARKSRDFNAVLERLRVGH